MSSNTNPSSTPRILLRHDIDRTPQRALECAQVEKHYGIRATYYFRVQRGLYDPGIMDRIAACGHEIGYHYETLDKCKGNMKDAKELFLKELADFRVRYDVKTVCAHGNPLTRYDNKDIWKDLNLKDCGLLGEAFLALDFSRFAYFSDSGGHWLNERTQKMPGKDAVDTAFDNIRAKSTDDVMRIIREGELPNICILSHPERWCKNFTGYVYRRSLDRVFNLGKVLIYVYRTAGKQYN